MNFNHFPKKAFKTWSVSWQAFFPSNVSPFLKNSFHFLRIRPANPPLRRVRVGLKPTRLINGSTRVTRLLNRSGSGWGYANPPTRLTRLINGLGGWVNPPTRQPDPPTRQPDPPTRQPDQPANPSTRQTRPANLTREPENPFTRPNPFIKWVGGSCRVTRLLNGSGSCLPQPTRLINGSGSGRDDNTSISPRPGTGRRSKIPQQCVGNLLDFHLYQRHVLRGNNIWIRLGRILGRIYRSKPFSVLAIHFHN